MVVPGVGLEPLDAFPAMDQGFMFSQTPDITISLYLLKKFFLNVTVLGDFNNNSIQMGYKGGPGEVVRSVVWEPRESRSGQSSHADPRPTQGLAGCNGYVGFGQLDRNRALSAGTRPRERRRHSSENTSWWSRRSASTRTCAADISSCPISGWTRTASGLLRGPARHVRVGQRSPSRKYRLATYDEMSPGFHLWTGLPAEHLQGKGAGLL